jgi:DNA polymerase-1
VSGRRFLFLDGSSLAYRAWFALPQELATSSGVQTNAVLGFASMLERLVTDQRPTGIAVAMDRPEPTFRDSMVEGYKEGRPATPDSLIVQMDYIRQMCSVLGVPVVEQEGLEADDFLATMATKAKQRQDEAIVVTGDRDCLQLVEDPYIKVLYNKRGVTDYELFDEARVLERYGISARLYVAYAAMRGDQSDNLPGVPGIGEKRAAALLHQYESLEGIYAHLEELTPKQRQALLESRERVFLNVELMTLKRDCELPFDLDDLRLGQVDVQAAKEFFQLLEMANRGPKLIAVMSSEAIGVPPETRPDVSEQSIALDPGTSQDAAAAHALSWSPRQVGPLEVGGLLSEYRSKDSMCLLGWWAGDPGRSDLLGLLIADAQPKETSRAALLLHREDLAEFHDTVTKVLNPTGSATGNDAAPRDEPSPTVHAWQAKEIMRSLIPLGIDFVNLDIDVNVAAYLLDPGLGALEPRELLSRLTFPASPEAGFWHAETARKELLVTSATNLAEDSSGQEMPAPVLSGNLEATSLLGPSLRHQLQATGQEELYDEIERPLIRVLARMEVRGIAVDLNTLREIASDMDEATSKLREKVWQLAGQEFNLGSVPQLRKLLYEDLGLSPARTKKTKTGLSTDASTLEQMIDQHPIVQAILDYREAEKLRSTYGSSLIETVGHDGRIHATFRQTVARTGRLSSENPNLHNIPVRTNEGRRLREAFVAAPGMQLCVGDYDQIELRVIAHLSQDPGLIQAFRDGVDIHRFVASQVFGIPPDQITPEQRERAKMVDYGLSYGMEGYGLARRLGIEVEEANAILDRYFESFPGVKAFMEESVRLAREKGYTETPLHRRRPIGELHHRNRNVRLAAERQAMNAGTQGFAADLFKLALVKLDKELERRGLAAGIVLQVHDEILLEAPPEEKETVEELMRSSMVNAYPLSVPIVVKIGWGRNWREAKGG